MKSGFLPLLNKNGQTPEEVFTKNHEDLVKEGRDWLISTPDAYSHYKKFGYENIFFYQ